MVSIISVFPIAHLPTCGPFIREGHCNGAYGDTPVSCRQDFIAPITFGAIKRIVHTFKQLIHTLARIMSRHANADGETR